MYSQLEMVSVECLMPKDHAYRHFKKLVDFVKVLKIAKKIEKELGAIGGFRIERKNA